jgi:hypothetical protein
MATRHIGCLFAGSIDVFIAGTMGCGLDPLRWTP